tara:strand:- start:200 stop:1240 length:1041 start_codon:yes stop_codon:yes gene_type:complete
VFHYHNIYYWLFPPEELNYNFKKNKYYDSTILFQDYKLIDNKKKALMSDFIKTHYSPQKYEQYNPSNQSILANFENHNDVVYISIYNQNNNIIGFMSSIPYEATLYNTNMNIYYIDFLCVHKNKRKKGLASNIIYSHAVNMYDTIKNMVYIFKREGALSSYVPLTIYNCYIFDTKHWVKNVTFIGKQYNICSVSDTHLGVFKDLIVDIKQSTLFNCVYHPYVGNLDLLIKNKNLFVFMLMSNDVCIACYVYKNNSMKYDGKISIDLIASYSNTSDDIFVMGYLNTLKKLYSEIKYDLLLVENISHNYIILKNILERYSYLHKSTMGYYYYNYANRPVYSKDVFCIT